MSKLTQYLVLFVITFSCNCKIEKAETTIEPSIINSVLKYQQERLLQIQPLVTKYSDFNGIKDTSVFKKSNWDQEMALFYELDIFKPAQKGAFCESKSGNNIKYNQVAISKSHMDSLTIYKNSIGKIDSIKGFGSHQNFFFKTRNKYFLQFDSATSLLKKYCLFSEKTFVWGKHDSFSIFAVINN